MANTDLAPDSIIAPLAKLPPEALDGTKLQLSADWLKGDFASSIRRTSSNASNQNSLGKMHELTLEQPQSALPLDKQESSSSSPGLSSGPDSDPTAATNPEAANPASAESLGSAYVDFNSLESPSAGANLAYKNMILNIAAGADADQGLHVSLAVSIMEASVKLGKLTVGALPTSMSVESSGPTNPFNTYSDIFENVRTTALGAKYSPNDKFSVGITNDGNDGKGLVPNALEVTYTTPLTPDTTVYTGADLSAHQATVDANVDYTKDRLNLSADFLQQNDLSIGSVECSFEVDIDLSVCGRLQSTDKEAVAVRDELAKHFFVQAQEENGVPSVEGGLQMSF